MTPVTSIGAVPVPVDCSLTDYNIDPFLIESCITSRTKAIIVVHLYGMPVNLQAIKSIADKYSLYMIEDAAQAHGALYDSNQCLDLFQILLLGVFIQVKI